MLSFIVQLSVNAAIIDMVDPVPDYALMTACCATPSCSLVMNLATSVRLRVTFPAGVDRKLALY